jgi:hypothetical protein
MVGVFVGVRVGNGVAVLVGVGVRVGAGVGVFVLVGVRVTVGLLVSVGVTVGLLVSVGVRVGVSVKITGDGMNAVGVLVGTAAGTWNAGMNDNGGGRGGSGGSSSSGAGGGSMDGASARLGAAPTGGIWPVARSIAGVPGPPTGGGPAVLVGVAVRGAGSLVAVGSTVG